MNTRATLAQALDPTVRQWIGGNFVSMDEVAAMREWVCDCAVSECRTDEECEDNLTTAAAMDDRAVLRYVARRFEGGVAGFIQAGPEVDILSA